VVPDKVRGKVSGLVGDFSLVLDLKNTGLDDDNEDSDDDDDDKPAKTTGKGKRVRRR
jgi:hypothetical protein